LDLCPKCNSELQKWVAYTCEYPESDEKGGNMFEKIEDALNKKLVAEAHVTALGEFSEFFQEFNKQYPGLLMPSFENNNVSGFAVQFPENLIVIDFDIRDEDGNRTLLS
jgi:hypothetical protein